MLTIIICHCELPVFKFPFTRLPLNLSLSFAFIFESSCRTPNSFCLHLFCFQSHTLLWTLPSQIKWSVVRLFQLFVCIVKSCFYTFRCSFLFGFETANAQNEAKGSKCPWLLLLSFSCSLSLSRSAAKCICFYIPIYALCLVRTRTSNSTKGEIQQNTIFDGCCVCVFLFVFFSLLYFFWKLFAQISVGSECICEIAFSVVWESLWIVMWFYYPECEQHIWISPSIYRWNQCAI